MSSKSSENNIILVMCPPWGVLSPPLSISCLSEYLNIHGINAVPIDLNLDFFEVVDSEDHKILWDSYSNKCIDLSYFSPLFVKHEEFFKRAVDKILVHDPKIVGFSINSSNKLFTLKFIELLKTKKPDLKILAGGFAIKISEGMGLFIDGGVLINDKIDYGYYQNLLNLIDCYVIGEGEEVLKNLLSYFFNNNNFPYGMPGVYRKGDETESFIRQTSWVDINTLPFPKYREFDLSKYKSKTLTLFTSRGCIRSCFFCADKVHWKGYRLKKLETTIDEIDYHKTNYKINDFIFSDLLINGDIDHLRLLLTEIIDRKFEISWLSNFLIRDGMDDPSLAYLVKRSGCRDVIFGVETGSDKIMKHMGKRFNRDLVIRVIKNFSAASLKIAINIMAGFPMETEADFLETLDLLKKLRPYISYLQNVNHFFVAPNSPLEKMPHKWKVTLPPKEHYNQWNSSESNFDVRIDRVKRILELCKSMDLPVQNKIVW